MRTARLRRARPWLGTLIDMRVDGRDDARALAAIEAAFAEVARVHEVMSFHTNDSDLARLRRAARGTVVPIDARTGAVLRCALRMAARSHGAFDPCIGYAAVVGGILPRPPDAPLPDADASWRDIELLDDTHVRLRRALWIDLGGIAKGFAVDAAVDVLRAHGAEQLCVNAGGDLRVAGAAAESIALRIGADDACNLIELSDGAVATSASSSLLAAHGDTSVRGISVIAPTCMLADALTKVVWAAPASLTKTVLRECAAQACLHRSDAGIERLGLAA